MKILITETNLIVSFGEFVFANKGQTIVDTEELTVANIKEIATKNGATITAKKKADIVAQLNDHMVEHNTEVNTMSDNEKYEKIVVEGIEAGQKDGEIARHLFDAGVEFEDIAKTIKTIANEKGLRLTPKARNIKTAEFLEGYVPDGVENHLGKVAALQDHLKCSTTQAGASMRKWAKDNDVELPKVPKKSASKIEPGFRGNIKPIADWALAQEVQPTLEELEAFAKENVPLTKGGHDSSKGHALTIFNAIIFANAMYAPVEEEVVDSEMEEAA